MQVVIPFTLDLDPGVENLHAIVSGEGAAAIIGIGLRQHVKLQGNVGHEKPVVSRHKAHSTLALKHTVALDRQVAFLYGHQTSVFQVGVFQIALSLQQEHKSVFRMDQRGAGIFVQHSSTAHLVIRGGACADVAVVVECQHAALVVGVAALGRPILGGGGGVIGQVIAVGHGNARHRDRIPGGAMSRTGGHVYVACGLIGLMRGVARIVHHVRHKQAVRRGTKGKRMQILNVQITDQGNRALIGNRSLQLGFQIRNIDLGRRGYRAFTRGDLDLASNGNNVIVVVAGSRQDNTLLARYDLYLLEVKRYEFLCLNGRIRGGDLQLAVTKVAVFQILAHDAEYGVCNGHRAFDIVIHLRGGDDTVVGIQRHIKVSW